MTETYSTQTPTGEKIILSEPDEMPSFPLKLRHIPGTIEKHNPNLSACVYHLETKRHYFTTATRWEFAPNTPETITIDGLCTIETDDIHRLLEASPELMRTAKFYCARTDATPEEFAATVLMYEEMNSGTETGNAIKTQWKLLNSDADAVITAMYQADSILALSKLGTHPARYFSDLPPQVALYVFAEACLLEKPKPTATNRTWTELIGIGRKGAWQDGEPRLFIRHYTPNLENPAEYRHVPTLYFF